MQRISCRLKWRSPCKKCPYLEFFSSFFDAFRPEKLPIRTLFPQWFPCLCLPKSFEWSNIILYLYHFLQCFFVKKILSFCAGTPCCTLAARWTFQAYSLVRRVNSNHLLTWHIHWCSVVLLKFLSKTSKYLGRYTSHYGLRFTVINSCDIGYIHNTWIQVVQI